MVEARSSDTISKESKIATSSVPGHQQCIAPDAGGIQAFLDEQSGPLGYWASSAATVGPLHTPLADVAVLAHSHFQ